MNKHINIYTYIYIHTYNMNKYIYIYICTHWLEGVQVKYGRGCLRSNLGTMRAVGALAALVANSEVQASYNWIRNCTYDTDIRLISRAHQVVAAYKYSWKPDISTPKLQLEHASLDSFRRWHKCQSWPTPALLQYI